MTPLFEDAFTNTQLVHLEKTTTITFITHGFYTTQAVCDSASDFNLRPGDRGDFVTDRNRRFQYFVHTNIDDVQSCCTLCHHTPDCVTFQIDPQTDACTFTLLTASFSETPNDRLCPAGIMKVYDPYLGTYDGEYGLGLCAYLQYSDE